MRLQKHDKMFREYPDVVNIQQMCAMLGGIGPNTAYQLLKAGNIRYIRIGKSFKIPKICIIEYLLNQPTNNEKGI